MEQQNTSPPLHETPPTEPRKRGGCLTVFLAFILVANVLISAYYFLAAESLQRGEAKLPVGAIYTLGVFSVLNFVFALTVWNWKKIGVYGFCADALIIFVINIAIGVPLLFSFLGLVGPAILLFLIRPVWQYMQ